MRIGEISMNINTRACNYGSILHSWAFQYYLKKYENIGQVEIIDYVRKDLEQWNRKFPPLEWIKKRNLKRLIKSIITYPNYRKRLKKVDFFIEKNMTISKRKYTQADLIDCDLDYDVLVADSDTIWAPRGDGTFDEGYFLALPAMRKPKRISYAPSMGNACISKEQEKRIAKLLEQFTHISCRETYEGNLLVECTGRSIAKVLDPVFLPSPEDWESLIDGIDIKRKTGKYILIYQPVDESLALEEAAWEYAKNHNLDIIKITIADEVRFRRKAMRIFKDCSPNEFLYLIKNAEAVFTNSFHAICFSIIFEKDFYAFSRKDDKKVRDICEIVGLESKFFKNKEDYREERINYDKVREILAPQIRESKQWLHNAIFH